MNQEINTLTPGSCYRFVVKSAEEAATLIREKLGPTARVLSVRNLETQGLSRFWTSPRLEVIAQIAEAPKSTESDTPVEKESESLLNELVDIPESAKHTLESLLRRSGISDMVLGRIKQSPKWSEYNEAPLYRGLVEVGRYIQAEAEKKWSGVPLSRAAFFGPAGVGRTTALCKCISSDVFKKARHGHVVCVEFDKPNPSGPLPVFCEALGIPVVRLPASTQLEVPNGFVYFDLPGMAIGPTANNQAILDFFKQEKIKERVLVLNAAYDHEVLRSAYASGRALGATHVVFTHLDEIPRWGRLWDYLIEGSLEPLFFSTGPSISGDCFENVFGSLVRRTLAAGYTEYEDEEYTSVDESETKVMQP
jgi:flagellar biosynthesis protein FlhF